LAVAGLFHFVSNFSYLYNDNKMPEM